MKVEVGGSEAPLWHIPTFGRLCTFVPHFNWGASGSEVVELDEVWGYCKQRASMSYSTSFQMWDS